MKTLTRRQSEILAMVQDFSASHGCPPTTRDIQRHFGFASQNAAMCHLRRLRDKGALNWTARRSRSLRISHESPMTPGGAAKFTYIFHDEVSGKVKIGRTNDIKKRQIELETAYPCKLTLLALLPTDEWPELAVHRRFHADRIRGEWFHYSDAIRAFVSSFTPRTKGGRQIA